MWKTEEGAEELRTQFDKGELMRRIRVEPAGFRMMAVSMCNHDIYGGDDTPDPNNPNTTLDGESRTANGLFATKAAVEYAQDLYPTDDYFLHGTSAGSYGSYHVAWALEQQGLPPTGIVADSGVLNPPWTDAQVDGENCTPPSAARAIIEQRLHPDIVDPDNAPDLLVSRGELTAPTFQVWTQGDFLGCGLNLMECPLRDGSSPTLGSVDCQNEPMRAALGSRGPEGLSVSMRLCVDRPQTPMPCDMHVPTVREELNTDPAWPADFTAPIIDWVRTRLADDIGPGGPGAEVVCPGGADTGFLDVAPSNAHLNNIACASRRNVVLGFPDGTFRPDLTIRRDQVASIVARVLTQLGIDLPADPGDAFDDDDENVHELAINRLAEAGIFSGRGPRTFEPDVGLRRDQLAAMMVRAYRFATGSDVVATSDRFADDDGNVHESDIDLAFELGLAEGVTATTFAPDGEVPRDQMASFAVRIAAALIEGGFASLE